MILTSSSFMPYTVFLNRSSSPVDFYKFGDDLEIVYDGIVDFDIHNSHSSSEKSFGIHRLLDKVYMFFNKRSEQCCSSCRPITVGDVVIIGDLSFACTKTGWTNVVLPDYYWYSNKKSKAS